jgi:hypothetical protein
MIRGKELEAGQGEEMFKLLLVQRFFGLFHRLDVKRKDW